MPERLAFDQEDNECSPDALPNTVNEVERPETNLENKLCKEMLQNLRVKNSIWSL